MATDVAELRRLLSEATPGEWAVVEVGDYDRGCNIEIGAGARYVAGVEYDEAFTDDEHRRGRADAALIAAMRNDLPSLLDRLEAAEAVVEAGRTVYDAPTGDYCDGDCRALNHSLRCAETTRAWKALFAALARYDKVRRG